MTQAEERVLQTKLCDLLGIKYPIILAGMGRTSGPTLAAAISNVGGLGIIGGTYLQPEELRDWIGRMRRLTDKPFGVDLLAPVMDAVSGEGREAATQLPPEHVAYVERLKRELGVAEPKTTRHRWGISQELVQRQIQVVLEERPPVFASGLGIPAQLIPELHAQGIKVIGMVGNVRNARRVAEAGADIIVAQGHEAGGHTGRIGTLALVPQVVDAVSPTPVVAAGGIGNGRGLVAALALGAVGVWVGTAFLLCNEAFVDHIEVGILSQAFVDNWKQKLVEASEEDTRVTRLYSGKTARYLHNKLIERWEKDGPPFLPMPWQRMLIDDLSAGLIEAGKSDYESGMAGQIAGMVKETKSARQLVEGMVAEAIEILQRLPEYAEGRPGRR